MWGPIARTIVWLRFLILPAWIAGAALATIHLPSIFDAESGELGSFTRASRGKQTAAELAARIPAAFTGRCRFPHG